MNEITITNFPSTPSTPTEVRDVTALGDRINSRLPHDWSVVLHFTPGGNIVLSPKGFQIEEDGTFTRLGVTVDPDREITIEATATLTVEQVYVPGYLLEDVLGDSGDVEEALEGYTYSQRTMTFQNTEVTSVEDVYVEVEVETEVSFIMRASDLLDGALEYDDEDDLHDAIVSAATLVITETFGCHDRDVAIEAIDGAYA